MALVTGDDATCREARALWGDKIVTAAVKKARGRLAATCLGPEETYRIIYDAAIKSAQLVRGKKAPVLDFASSWIAEIAFLKTAQCDVAATLPFVERLDGRRVRFGGSDPAGMRRCVSAVLDLAGTAPF